MKSSVKTQGKIRMLFPSLRHQRHTPFPWAIIGQFDDCSDMTQTITIPSRPCLQTHRETKWVIKQLVLWPIRGQSGLVVDGLDTTEDGLFVDRPCSQGIGCPALMIGKMAWCTAGNCATGHQWGVCEQSLDCLRSDNILFRKCQRCYLDDDHILEPFSDNPGQPWTMSEHALGSPRPIHGQSCTPKLPPFLPNFLYKYWGLHPPRQSCFRQQRDNPHHGTKPERLWHNPCKEGQEHNEQ